MTCQIVNMNPLNKQETVVNDEVQTLFAIFITSTDLFTLVFLNSLLIDFVLSWATPWCRFYARQDLYLFTPATL